MKQLMRRSNFQVQLKVSQRSLFLSLEYFEGEGMEEDEDMSFLIFSIRWKGYYIHSGGPSPTWKSHLSIQHGKIIDTSSHLTFG